MLGGIRIGHSLYLLLTVVSLALLTFKPRYGTIATIKVLFGHPSLLFMPPTMRATKKARSTETVQPEASLHVEAPPSFDLGLAISSYGFFMLPPNQWVKVRIYTAERATEALRCLCTSVTQCLMLLGLAGSPSLQGRLQKASESAERRASDCEDHPRDEGSENDVENWC